nr:MAG TPA: hypothetical protein [Microviridae sp.]
MKKTAYNTYSVYDFACASYLHISATSKAHVKEYLKVTALHCKDYRHLDSVLLSSDEFNVLSKLHEHLYTHLYGS